MLCSKFSMHAFVATFSSNSLDFSFMKLCKLSAVNSRERETGEAPEVLSLLGFVILSLITVNMAIEPLSTQAPFAGTRENTTRPPLTRTATCTLY